MSFKRGTNWSRSGPIIVRESWAKAWSYVSLQARELFPSAQFLPLLDMPATPAGKILLQVYARSAGVHLHIREEPTVSVTTVHHGVSAKENRGVVLRQLGLNPDFAPPITNQGLRCLPDGVARGLVGDLQGDAPVLPNAVPVGVQHAGIVQQRSGALD